MNCMNFNKIIQVFVTSKVLPLLNYKIRGIQVEVRDFNGVKEKSGILINSFCLEFCLDYKGLSVSFCMVLTLHFSVSGISKFQFSILEYLICIRNAF